MSDAGRKVQARRTGRKAPLAMPPLATPTVSALAAIQIADVLAHAPVTIHEALGHDEPPVAAPAAQTFDPAPAAAPAEPVVAEPVVSVEPVSIPIVEAAPSPAVSSDPLSAETLAPSTGVVSTMATIAPTFTDTAAATEKMQGMLGDVGARFKASVEKSSKLGEEFVELTKGNVEAVVASARVAAKGGEALGQDVAEYGKKSLEHAVAAMKSFASIKSPTELFQLQSEFAKASFDNAVAEASKFSESLMKLAGDVAQPLSTRYAVAAEKIKSVAA